jgi:L-alanine-DL-glutamate epimerase-like enolase superfamily enzyme
MTTRIRASTCEIRDAMKITDIQTEIKEHAILTQLFVRVTQEDGLSGTGECWWGVSPGMGDDKPFLANKQVLPMISAVESILKPLLIGEDARQIEARFQQMVRYAYRYGIEGIMGCAISGIDLALWDLAGKRAQLPVVELLGGQAKESVRAYASLPPMKDPGMIQKETERVMAYGFQGIKLHEHNPDLAGLVRDVAGPDMAIMFDVNGHFDLPEASDVAQALMTHNVFWFEEPTWPMRDHDILGRLKDATGITIAAGENEYSQESFYRLMQSGAADYVMPEITKIGGLSAGKKLTPLFELFNLPLSPHSFRIGPALYANIHWALSTDHSDWLEIPWLPEGFLFPGGVSIPELKDGQVTLPEGVGLGLSIT